MILFSKNEIAWLLLFYMFTKYRMVRNQEIAIFPYYFPLLVLVAATFLYDIHF